MEFISKPHQERENNNHHHNTSPTNSPHNNNGAATPRSDPNNPYPTTFVQADTSNFKQVVQLLTGSTTTTSAAAETFKQTPSRQSHIPPKKQGFKLYERRNHNNLTNNNNNNNSSKSSLMINTFLSPRSSNNAVLKAPEILSPSLLDFPSLSLLSPVTPLSNNDAVDDKSTSSSEEEERAAIAEKGFYLHPSPRDAEPPQLLPLFPLTSPRISGSATASSSS